MSDIEIVCDYNIPQRIFAMISDAKKDETLFIVSPYIALNENAKRCVKKAVENGAKVVFAVRSDSTENPERDIQELQKIGVIFHHIKFLHTKVYWSERQVIITSMNLLKTSMNDSMEIAVISDNKSHINKCLDIIFDLLGEQAKDYSYLRKAEYLSNSKSSVLSDEEFWAPLKKSTKPKKIGFCISGGEEISNNPCRPLCEYHYQFWNGSLRSYKGNYCHNCGKNERDLTEYYRPLCYSCWEKLGKPSFDPGIWI